MTYDLTDKIILAIADGGETTEQIQPRLFMYIHYSRLEELIRDQITTYIAENHEAIYTCDEFIDTIYHRLLDGQGIHNASQTKECRDYIIDFVRECNTICKIPLFYSGDLTKVSHGDLVIPSNTDRELIVLEERYSKHMGYSDLDKYIRYVVDKEPQLTSIEVESIIIDSIIKAHHSFDLAPSMIASSLRDFIRNSIKEATTNT